MDIDGGYIWDCLWNGRHLVAADKEGPSTEPNVPVDKTGKRKSLLWEQALFAWAPVLYGLLTEDISSRL